MAKRKSKPSSCKGGSCASLSCKRHAPIGNSQIFAIMLVSVFALSAVLLTAVFALDGQNQQIAEQERLLQGYEAHAAQ